MYEISKSVGMKLTELRLSRHLEIENVAELVGISSKQLDLMEDGEIELDLNNLNSLAKFYSTSVDQLILDERVVQTEVREMWTKKCIAFLIEDLKLPELEHILEHIQSTKLLLKEQQFWKSEHQNYSDL